MSSTKKVVENRDETMKNNKSGGKLLGGALVGAALGVAAGLLLAPESGKKLRGDLKRRSAEFYTYLSPRIKKMKKIGEKEYGQFVKNATKSYSKAKRLSSAEAKALAAEAQKTWKHLQKHL